MIRMPINYSANIFEGLSKARKRNRNARCFRRCFRYLCKNEIRAVVSQVMQLPIHRIIIVPMENKEEK